MSTNAVELERLGIPTVTVVSDAFVRLAAAEAASLGLAALPLVVVPHPVALRAPDELLRLERDLGPQVRDLLTTTPTM